MRGVCNPPPELGLYMQQEAHFGQRKPREQKFIGRELLSSRGLDRNLFNFLSSCRCNKTLISKLQVVFIFAIVI